MLLRQQWRKAGLPVSGHTADVHTATDPPQSCTALQAPAGSTCAGDAAAVAVDCRQRKKSRSMMQQSEPLLCAAHRQYITCADDAAAVVVDCTQRKMSPSMMQQ